MFHAVSYAIFMVVFAKWVEFEMGRKFNLQEYWLWIGAAVASAIAASIIDQIVGGKTGNFILHGLGGGAASAFMFTYLIKTFEFRLSWRVLLVALFAFVSMLGAMNEILEYFLEELGVAIMSIDTHDTWRDFVANTLGALIGWVAINVAGKIQYSSNKQR